MSRVKPGTFALSALMILLVAALAACGQQPSAVAPAGSVAVTVSLDESQFAPQELTAQGVPFEASGVAGVENVTVAISDKNGATVSTVHLTKADPTETLTLPEVGNPYTFTSHGFHVATGPVIAYDTQTKIVANNVHVRVGLKAVLGRALLVPRYPTNHVYPSPDPLDLMLVVLANGYDDLSGGYLQVPVGDYAAAYGSVTDADVLSSSPRGLRLRVTGCQVKVAQGSASGFTWDGTQVVAGSVAIEPYTVGCDGTGSDLGGDLSADLQAPEVTLIYDPTTGLAIGSANDNDRIAKVQLWDGTVLVASTEPAEASSSVKLFQFDIGRDTFSVQFDTATFHPVGGLTALAFDPAGNQGRSGETASLNVAWVDASFSGTSDGSAASPFKTIQDGITAINAGGTVWVRPGNYSGNLIIGKRVNLFSTDGRSVTKIQGDSSASGQGAVEFVPGASGSQLGSLGHGFHIVGFDGPTPGIERAAVYFTGANSNISVIDNEIEANGDLGLITTYSQPTNILLSVVISHNEFSGKTFTGTHPSGIPAGQDQWSVPNVARQLVAINRGAAYTTFTGNLISGTAGGLDTSNVEQGNTLVTVDGPGSLVADNTFTGQTARFGSSLRVRGPSNTITGNTFGSTGLTATTSHLYVEGTALDASLVTANSFDGGFWEAGAGSGTVYNRLPDVFPTVYANRVINVLPGTYVLGHHLRIDAPGITLRGPRIWAGSSSDPAQVDGGFAFNAPNISVGGFDVSSFGGYPAGDVAAFYLLPTASGATIHENSVDGAGIDPSRGVVNSTGLVGSATVTNNTFRNLTTGVFANAGITYLIQGNDFEGNVAGVGNDSPNSTIINNTFSGNAEGIGLGASGLTITGNTFTPDNTVYVRDYTGGTYDLNTLVGVNAFTGIPVVNGNELTP